jgi:hypothetical protein
MPTKFPIASTVRTYTSVHFLKEDRSTHCSSTPDLIAGCNGPQVHENKCMLLHLYTLGLVFACLCSPTRSSVSAPISNHIHLCSCPAHRELQQQAVTNTLRTLTKTLKPYSRNLLSAQTICHWLAIGNRSERATA